METETKIIKYLTQGLGNIQELELINESIDVIQELIIFSKLSHQDKVDLFIQKIYC